jgi:hypothetical protein
MVLKGWAARYKILPDGGRQITAFLLARDFVRRPHHDVRTNGSQHRDAMSEQSGPNPKVGYVGAYGSTSDCARSVMGKPRR